MGTWYYAVDGVAVGPVERDDLVLLAMDGTLGPETQVLDAGSTTWRTLAEAEDELGVAFPLFDTPGGAADPPSTAPPSGVGWAAPTAPPPAFPPPVAGTGTRLAAWWRRAAAWWIDSLLFSIPMTLIILPDINDLGDTSNLDQFLENLVTYASSSRFFTLQLGFAVASLVYQSVFNGRGQTLGKKLLGIRVQDVESGAPIGTGRAFRRQVLPIAAPFFVPIAGQLFVLVDALWPLWDPRNQAVHDKLARSVVVRAD